MEIAIVALRRRLTADLCSVQKGTDRDVEAQLMHLLDFEHFELVRELLRNRFTIVWCTRLQRAQADDERQRIEVSPANQLPQLVIWLTGRCALR